MRHLYVVPQLYWLNSNEQKEKPDFTYMYPILKFWNQRKNVGFAKKKLIIELLIKDLKKKPTAAIMSYIPMLWYLFI